MNNRELFKEAIADAKAVKEAAIANAKAALEESFAPYLKEKLTRKLEEMEESDEDYIEAIGDDITEMYGDEEIEEMKDDSDIYEDSVEEKKHSSEEAELDELLAELGMEELDEETDEIEEDLFEAEEAESDEDDEEINLEDMSEDKLVSFIEDVIKDMIESGELEAGESFEKEEDETETETKTEEDEVSIDELLFELKKKKAKKEKEEKEEKEDDKELKEAIKTINALQAELNEVNLLNAKLLYTNKIFKAKNLSESQKVKVLSTFDKATTVKEVKLVFESLNESLSTAKKEPIKESLGFASKATGVPNANKTQKIVEEDAMVARFKKLAGLN